MANATLQLNQLLGDPTMGAKKGAMNFAGILGAGNAAQVPGAQAFQGLLGGLMTGRTNVAVTDTLLTTQTSAMVPATGELTLNDILKGLPPEIANLLRAHVAQQQTEQTADATATNLGILDALSMNMANTGEAPELVTVIDDPKLAAALAGLASQLGALGEGALVAPLQGNLQQAVLSPSILEAAAKLKSHIDTLQKNTIDIASLDGDGFQALKKIAFADIAPFLTQPRNVVVDGKNVMKVAQGPSFLNDEGMDITTMALNAGLVPAITLPQTINNNPLQVGTSPVIAQESAVAAAAAPVLAPVLPGMVAAAKGQKTTSPTLNAATAGEGFVATGEAQGATAPVHTPKTAATATATATIQTAAPAGTNTAATAGIMTDSHSRGFGDVLEGLAGTTGQTFSAHSDDSFASGLKVSADQSLPGTGASTMMTARAAGQPHPGSHLVSIALQKNIDPRAPGTERQITIQMDPETLGRVRVTLSFGENNTVKAKLLAERPETLSLLQKDISMLERTLNNSGLDTSHADSFTFDLAQGDSFTGSMQDGNQPQHQGKNNSSTADVFGTENANVETVMSIFVDPATGQTHVNVVI